MIHKNTLAKYNQILFAIIGSIVVMGIAIGIIVSLIVISKNTFFKPIEKQTIVVPKKEAPKLRYSKVHMQAPQLIDKTSHLFLIPISQNRLDKPELLNSRASYTHYLPRQKLNNLILYNHKTKKTQQVVKNRSLITQYAYKKTSDKAYILFLGTQKDTNSNNELDSNDILAFFWYNIHTKTLNHTSLNTNVISFNLHETYKDDEKTTQGIFSNEVMIQIKHDEDSSRYCILNLDSGTIQSIISDSEFNALQEILDLGKNTTN